MGGQKRKRRKMIPSSARTGRITVTAVSAGDSLLLRLDSVSDGEPDPEPEPEPEPGPGPELGLEPDAPAVPVAAEVGTTEIAGPGGSDAVVRTLADETVTETPPVDNAVAVLLIVMLADPLALLAGDVSDDDGDEEAATVVVTVTVEAVEVCWPFEAAVMPNISLATLFKGFKGSNMSRG